jgi:surface protein
LNLNKSNNLRNLQKKNSFIRVIFVETQVSRNIQRQILRQGTEEGLFILESNDGSINGYKITPNKNGEIEIILYAQEKLKDISEIFQNRFLVTLIDFSKFNSTGIKYGQLMFKGCTSLKSINMNGFIFSGENGQMDSIFSDLISLESISLENIVMIGITDFKNMFNNTISLTSLDLSYMNTSSVVYMNNMFLNCRSLKFLNLSNFDTSNVINMENMFSGCSNLTSIILSSFNTSKVKKMTNMFKGCSSLLSLNLSNFKLLNALNIDYMFSGCSSINYIEFSIFKVAVG